MSGGSNPSCEDTFHFNSTEVEYQSPCLTGRKGREGLFPASSCVKLSGSLGRSDGPTFFTVWMKDEIFPASGGSLMTRGCSADSGTTTADTEIVRISHCGAFYFDNK